MTMDLHLLNIKAEVAYRYPFCNGVYVILELFNMSVHVATITKSSAFRVGTWYCQRVG